MSVIISRWWDQWNQIPWIDRLAHVVIANVRGHDVAGRLLRRNLLRYVQLSSMLVYRLMSPTIMERFPELQDLVTDGYMSQRECDLYEACDSVHWKYWIPFTWFSGRLAQGFDEGRIRSSVGYKQILEELNIVRSQLGTLVGYDWVNIPLVYTQVVTIAVHSYFVMGLFAHQTLDPEGTIRLAPTARIHTTQSSQLFANCTSQPDSFCQKISTYVPFYMILEFLFYMGWLKVAEQLINPFCGGDDDFEMNEIIDRNMEVAMRMVDETLYNLPELHKDEFFDSNLYCRKNSRYVGVERCVSKYEDSKVLREQAADKRPRFSDTIRASIFGPRKSRNTRYTPKMPFQGSQSVVKRGSKSSSIFGAGPSQMALQNRGTVGAQGSIRPSKITSRRATNMSFQQRDSAFQEELSEVSEEVSKEVESGEEN